mmetsp:Transcript_388/g.759  ORF Transcript_388/g.759 Transcript_388/m.759 type:complete len:118 (-) Transcript_388:49-402(-)
MNTGLNPSSPSKHRMRSSTARFCIATVCPSSSVTVAVAGKHEASSPSLSVGVDDADGDDVGELVSYGQISSPCLIDDRDAVVVDEDESEMHRQKDLKVWFSAAEGESSAHERHCVVL